MDKERRLHIGGTEEKAGWEIFNTVPSKGVAHVGNANDLTRFEDQTFLEIYASHVLEHFSYKEELLQALKEWNRVLKPGGILCISVPDLDILATLFTKRDLFSLEERFFIMRMIFGGHMDEYDYHSAGLNQEFLTWYLTQAGFADIRRVKEFGIFQDTSTMVYKGVAISLNMMASK